MSLDWQIQHRWGSHNHNLTPFLAISLLLHGAVFLGLAIYWHGKSVNHLLQPQPEAIVPVKFIDLPPEEAAITPPPHAKYLASKNSRAGGQVRRDLPVMTGRLGTRPTSHLPSSPHILTQAKLSSPHPTQPRKLLPQPPPAPPAIPVPLTSSYLNSSPSIALPKRQPSKQPVSPPASSVVKHIEQLPTPEPLTHHPDASPPPLFDSQQPSSPASPEELPPIPEPVMPEPRVASPSPSPEPKQPIKRLLPRPQINPVVKLTQHPPNASRLAFNSRPNRNSSMPPPRIQHTQNSDRQSLSQQSRSVTEGKQHSSTSNRLAFNPPVSSKPSVTASQLPQKSHHQLPSWQQASSLGGTVSLPSHNFSDSGDNLPNANRLALNSAGVDTREDDLGPYKAALRRKVIQHWHPEAPESSKHTVVVFSINRDGQITSPVVIRSSGSLKLDQAAMQAVEQAAPFAPLPKSFPYSQYDITFTFNVIDIDVDIH